MSRIRKDAVVVDLALLLVVEPAEVDAPALARERHRLREVHELHRSADDGPRVLEVLAAVDRRDLAQRRMDAGAVITLLVVLDDRLPVGLHDVLVSARDEGAPGLPVLDQVTEVPEVCVEAWRLAVGVHEDPAHPLPHGDIDQRVRALVEPRHVAEPGSSLQRAVQPVHPGVIRALDGVDVPRLAARQQLVPPVATGVEVASDLAVLPADQQDALVADANRHLVPRRAELVRSAHVHP
jgi:hypothetical protein